MSSGLHLSFLRLNIWWHALLFSDTFTIGLGGHPLLQAKRSLQTSRPKTRNSSVISILLCLFVCRLALWYISVQIELCWWKIMNLPWISGAKKFVCPKCGKKLATAWSLSKHMKNHSRHDVRLQKRQQLIQSVSKYEAKSFSSTFWSYVLLVRTESGKVQCFNLERLLTISSHASTVIWHFWAVVRLRLHLPPSHLSVCFLKIGYSSMVLLTLLTLTVSRLRSPSSVWCNFLTVPPRVSVAPSRAFWSV